MMCGLAHGSGRGRQALSIRFRGESSQLERSTQLPDGQVENLVGHTRRRSDILGKESFPYGSDDLQNQLDELGAHDKDRLLDRATHQPERRRSVAHKIGLATKLKATPKPVKRNVEGTRVGYNPYESGQLTKGKNPGVKRDLRELGEWLKTQPVNIVPTLVRKKRAPRP
jgi:hypothetical protein